MPALNVTRRQINKAIHILDGAIEATLHLSPPNVSVGGSGDGKAGFPRTTVSVRFEDLSREGH